LAPDGSKVYAYYESANGSFVSIIDAIAKPAQEVGLLSLIGVSAGQFEGLSFAQGGQKLLLPGDEGVFAFDMSDSKNPSLLYKWPLGKSYQIDITNKGQSFCVSLGEQGIECADFVKSKPSPSRNPEEAALPAE
jgi:hypothetical protein